MLVLFLQVLRSWTLRRLAVSVLLKADHGIMTTDHAYLIDFIICYIFFSKFPVILIEAIFRLYLPVFVACVRSYASLSSKQSVD